MQAALRTQTTVLPGRKIEVAADELTEGQQVEVIIVFPQDTARTGRSVLDIVADAPGQVLFQSAEQVENYIRTERSSWDR